MHPVGVVENSLEACLEEPQDDEVVVRIEAVPQDVAEVVQPYVAVVEQTEAEEVPKSSGEAVGMVAAGHPFEDGNLEEDLLPSWARALQDQEAES